MLCGERERIVGKLALYQLSYARENMMNCLVLSRFRSY